MPAVARVGDLGVGVCYAHKDPVNFVTTFVSGDPTVFAEGQAVVTIGGIGTTSCGHHTMAMSGSSNVFGTGGQALHRVGDVGVVIEDSRGTYVCSSGSPTVYAGG